MDRKWLGVLLVFGVLLVLSLGVNILLYSKTATIVSSPTPLPLSFITPKEGETVSGTVKIVVVAPSDLGLSRVSLYDSYAGEREKQIGFATTNPYEFTWISVNDYNGPHKLRVVASDITPTDSSKNEFSASIDVTLIGGRTVHEIYPPTLNCNGGPCYE